MIQNRLKKIEEIKYCVTLKKKNIDKEKEDSTAMFRSIVSSFERLQADLIMVLEEKRRDVERQAEQFVKALQEEIAELKRSNDVLEKLLHSGDHVHLLQSYLTLSTSASTNTWDEVKINSSLSVEDVMSDLHHLQQSVNKTTEKISGLISPDYQREEIARLLKTELQIGDIWYLVDSRWFKSWKKYVGFDSWNRYCMGDPALYPGPVDNSGLLTDSVSMKEYLIDELDYVLLPKEAWGKLTSWYGLSENQEPITRKVIEHGMFVKYLKVEVYVNDVRLDEFGNMD